MSAKHEQPTAICDGECDVDATLATVSRSHKRALINGDVYPGLGPGALCFRRLRRLGQRGQRTGTQAARLHECEARTTCCDLRR